MNPVKKLYCRMYQAFFRLIHPFLPYRTPQIINHVDDIVPILESEGCCRPLIVTARGIRAHGLTAMLEYTLMTAEIPFFIYDNTISNPTVQNAEEALHIFQEEKCDCLIGIGGGSCMDCAKAVGACLARPKKKLSKMRGFFKIRQELPLLIEIPTTAGTGSEATPAADITDTDTLRKYTLVDCSLIPDYTVLDQSLTISLPAFLTVTTGMDALTRAIEVYIGKSIPRCSRKKALRAIKLIFENLDAVWKNGNDSKARRKMLYASFYAGCAFTKGRAGYCHAISHSLEGAYNIPHSFANAVLLPVVLEAYGNQINKRLRQLALEIGLADKNTSPEDASFLFIKAIKEMKKHYGIPDTIFQLNPKDISKLCKQANKEANPLYSVPVLMNARELRQIYLKIIV